MQNDKGTLWYGVGLDNKDFKRQAQEVRNQFKRIGDTARKESNEMNKAFKALSAGIVTYLSGRELFQFGKDIAMVRGEFQQLEVAFTTMLKSKAKADALMSDVVKFASTTPYELQDVGKGAKQLLAFQVPAKEVTKTLRQIGDLAAGVGAPLNDLVSIYGKVKAKGKLQAEEMNLFLERGIPLVSELAKKYETTEQAIYKMASNGEVAFEDMHDVLVKLTSEGGMFFNLMDKQSKTITGQISNLSDAWAQMLNEIGQSHESAIGNSIQSAKYLVEHYKEVWDILKVLITTYGSYKAAVMSLAAFQKASFTLSSVKAWFQLAKGIKTAKDAQIAFNLATKANPIGIIASAITGLITVLFTLKRRQQEHREEIQKQLQPLKDQYRETNSLITKLKDANLSEAERLKTLKQLKEVNPKITEGIENEADAIETLTQRLETYNQEQLAAINVKEYSLSGGFTDSGAELKEANDNLNAQKSILIGTYAELFDRFHDLLRKNKDIPENVRTLFSSIFESDNDVPHKMEVLFAALESTQSKTRTAGSSSERSAMHNLFIGLDVDTYKNTLEEYNKANNTFAAESVELKQKIESVGTALYKDEQQRKEWISNQKQIYFPSETLKPKDKPKPIFSDIEDEIKETSELIQKLEGELKKLRSGQTESVNYADDIEKKAKSLSEAKKTLKILTGQKEYNNYEKELAKLEKLSKDKASAIKQLELAAEQARIDAMEKGAEKTLAQNELNYKRQVLQIEKQKADMLQKLKDVDKAAWEADGGKGKFQSKITELPAELNKAFIDQTKTALIELERANAKTFDELLKASGTNSNDVSAILQAIAKTQRAKLDNIAQYETLKLKELAKDEQKYDAETYKKKKALINQEAKDATEAVREEAQKALESIPKQLLDDLFSDFDLSFTNLDHATLGQLNNVADKLTKLSLNKNELIKLGLTEEQIIRLESVLKELKEEGLANTETAKLDRVRDIFSEVGAAMSQASDEMTRSIGQMVTSIANLVTTLNDPNAKGFEKASGIVSFAIAAGNELAKIRTQSMNKEVDAQKRINEGVAEQLTLERELNRIRRERAEVERNSSAFLESYYKDDYKAALNTLKESDKLIDDSLKGILDGGVFSAKGSAKRRLFGRKSGTYEFSIKQILGDYATKYSGEGAADILPLLFGGVGGIGTGQLLNGGSFKDIIGGLLDPAGIFGGYADGKAQKNALKKLRESFDKTFKEMGKTSADMANMSSQEWVDFFSLMEEMGHITDPKSTKEMIENAKAAAEDYAKAMEEMKNIISDVAGNLGSSLQDTLVTAFENGEDAALSFKDTVSDVLQSIFMKNLEATFFKKYFDKLQEEMQASMDGGDGDWSDDIKRFIIDITPAIKDAEDMMSVFKKTMEEEGFEVFGGGSRKGASKGFTAMSQDTGDELNGRFTAIQSHTYSINEQMKTMMSNSAAMLRHMAGIEKNTHNLNDMKVDMSSMNNDIGKMKESIKGVQSGINTINTQGIKLKR